MCKRLLSLLLTLLILCSLFGCMPSGTKLYPIYLMPGGSGPEIFLDTVSGIDRLQDTQGSSLPSEPEQAREILFGGDLISLNYQKQSDDGCYVYASADNTLTCQFSPNSGALRMLSAENWFDTTAAPNMSEDAYISWIREQISSYYTEDWDQYVLTCKTQMRDTYSGRSSIQEENGFLMPFDSFESVESYVFTFTKYLGEYTTTDVIRVRIHPQTGFTSLEFSPHQFDHTEPVEIDPELIQASVFQFLSDSIGKSKYSYTKHASSKPTLSYINGHLVYLCNIQIDVASLNDIEKFETELVVQPVAILLR